MNIETMLYQHAPAVRDALLESLPVEDAIPHEFSPGFTKKMKRLLRRQRHPVFYRIVQRSAAAILAVLLGGACWLTVDAEARAGFIQWIREIYQTRIVYHFLGPQDHLAETYYPAWIPDGYSEWKIADNSVAFSNDAGEILVFSYLSMQKGIGVTLTETDKTVIQEVMIHDISGQLFLSLDPEISNTLTWTDQDARLFFSISGFLSETDILHMAESVSLVDSPK